MKLLVVEDEPGLLLGIQDFFEEYGFQVVAADTGGDALEALDRERPDLMILDLGLPDMDGNAVIKAVREKNAGTPILVLTARTQETDTIRSFKLGADDYVTKPFSLQILKVRVDALLRRRGVQGDRLRLGDIILDFSTFRATNGEESLHLSTREFEILNLLRQHQGSPVSRNDILDEVWGMDSTSGARTVDTYITWIRKKIEPVPEKPRYLLSQRGVGYKLVLED